MNSFRLRIESGPSAGTVRDIPPSGLSVGRSARNDLAISDAMLSRSHCKFYVEGGSLYVSDLATVNGTFVDGSQIETDSPLHPGAEVKIGETVLRVSNDNGEFPPTPEPAAALDSVPAPDTTSTDGAEARGAGNHADSKSAESSSGAPDLFGASSQPNLFPPPAPAPAGEMRRNLVANVAIICAAVVLLAGAAKIFLSPRASDPLPAPEPAPTEPPISFSYVKLEGSESNVFRYEMELSPDGTLEVAIDDAAQGRHVRKRADSPLPDERRAELLRLFDEASFSSLVTEDEGRPRRNEWREIRISALAHGRPNTVVVRNREEPAALSALRDALEDFGRNELGLWAFAVDRDTLVSGAEEDFERAERLHDEREVLPGNLYNAVRIYDSCIARLETLDPRPELFDIASAARSAAAKELDARVEALNWRAEHAANMKDWAEAAAALRDLAEVVPDRSDPRNEAARRRLLDAESRIGRK